MPFALLLALSLSLSLSLSLTLTLTLTLTLSQTLSLNPTPRRAAAREELAAGGAPRDRCFVNVVRVRVRFSRLYLDQVP